jgi:hypothetical protein
MNKNLIMNMTAAEIKEANECWDSMFPNGNMYALPMNNSQHSIGEHPGTEPEPGDEDIS